MALVGQHRLGGDISGMDVFKQRLIYESVKR